MVVGRLLSYSGRTLFYVKLREGSLIPQQQNKSPSPAWICLFDAYEKSKKHILPNGREIHGDLP